MRTNAPIGMLGASPRSTRESMLWLTPVAAPWQVLSGRGPGSLLAVQPSLVRRGES